MRIEQHIIAAWAKQLSDKVIKDSIATLEQMDSNETLSGEDSGLKNVWEEICVQVQYDNRSWCPNHGIALLWRSVFIPQVCFDELHGL